MLPESTGKIIGVDIAKSKFDVFCYGMTMQKYIYTNDTVGIEEFVTISKEASVDLVVLEATGVYHTKLAYALAANNIKVTVTNPQNIRHFAKSMNIRAKTDRVDAKVLCEYGRYIITRDDFSTYVRQLPSEERQILRDMNDRRHQWIAMRTAELQRLEKTRATIQKNIREHIEYINKNITDIDDDISRYIDQHFSQADKTLQSIPGIGSKTSTTLLAELPELGILNRRQISFLAGLAPLARDSGTQRGKRFIYGGRAKVRSALYMATLSAVQHNEVIQQFYTRLLAKGKPKMIAFTACMRKLLTIANVLLREQRIWQPTMSINSP